MSQLPPPDPNEFFADPPAACTLPAPTVVFAAGPPTPEVDRAADRLLDLRPGLLIVFARG